MRIPPQPPGPDRQGGIALVLTLIFSILLYVIIAELVVSGRMVRMTGENDALLARMRNQMDYTLKKAEEMLLDDMAAAAAAEEGGEAGAMGGLGGALGGAGGAPGGEGGVPGEEGAAEADAAGQADSSRDPWYQPQAFSDGDITTYVWIEPENSKFNILSMWSPDQDFAQVSRERFVRLLDALREDTDFDLTESDAELIASELDDWVNGRTRNDAIPRPPLKSQLEENPDLIIPVHLDELRMLASVTDEMFFDKVLDGRHMYGLESVLTVYTSLGYDPGDPEKVARQQAQRERLGETEPAAPAAPAGEEPAAPGAPEEAPQPEGIGIRINLNTAPRPVLRCLFPHSQVSDMVIDAILRHRNEVSEEDEEAMAEEAAADSYFSDLQLGESPPLKFYAEVSELEDIPEFANLPDAELKAEFQRLCTTKSDVFSIHMAALHLRNEENRIYVLNRTRTVVMRLDNGEDGYLHPLILQEERQGMRVMGIDFPEEREDLAYQYNEMDYFAQEERAWNPFLLEFYLPQYQREQFFYPR